MNTITREVSDKMTAYRNGAGINLKDEIALILMRPTNPTIVTPSTQSLGKTMSPFVH